MDNSTVIEKPIDVEWTIQIPIALMLGAPIYLAILVFVIICAIKQYRDWRWIIQQENDDNFQQSSDSQEIQDINPSDSYVIHYWMPYEGVDGHQEITPI